jgi:sugar lactone lactonase YvrE
MRFRRLLALIASIIVVAAGVYLWIRTRPPREFVSVVTLAGTGPKVVSRDLADPFGIAVDKNDVVFVSDGKGGRIFRLAPSGDPQLVAEGLNMPSAIAIAADGTLIVASTGDHSILRVDPIGGKVSLIAGSRGIAGYRDGIGPDALFNGPIGVDVNRDGTIVVADTYNDRLRAIGADGKVTTMAGGNEPGFVDGTRDQARFDTPCAVAVLKDGTLVVADTGNNRIRRVTTDGVVSTLAGSGEVGARDGSLAESTFDEPVALVVRRDGAIFVADAGCSCIRTIAFGEAPFVATVSGSHPTNLIDGAIGQASMNRPAGLAFTRRDALIFADSGNGLVRALLPRGAKQVGRISDPSIALIAASDIRQTVAPRWPFNPADARREIAGTFGEIRGEMLPEHDTWFHSGLDVPGAYGETVRAVFGEQVTRPISVEGAGQSRERLRLPTFGYIHIRVGRDSGDHMVPGFDRHGFSVRRAADGRIEEVRIRRGARFDAGDALGTLNSMNHVHLVSGPPGAEVNALAALSLPGLADHIPPVIEDVTLTDENGKPFSRERGQGNTTVNISGRVRIIVRAYDQIDGNSPSRRLAPYRFAYQVLDDSGQPSHGFEAPRETIVFERLPHDSSAVSVAYAEGSQSGYEGRTIFSYLITNQLRDGKAVVDYWNANELRPGRYALRVLVADFFGNQSRRELVLRVSG